MDQTLINSVSVSEFFNLRNFNVTNHVYMFLLHNVGLTIILVATVYPEVADSCSS